MEPEPCSEGKAEGHHFVSEEERHGLEDGNRRLEELATRDFWYVLTSRHRTLILCSGTWAGWAEDVEQAELKHSLIASIPLI